MSRTIQDRVERVIGRANQLAPNNNFVIDGWEAIKLRHLTRAILEDLEGRSEGWVSGLEANLTGHTDMSRRLRMIAADPTADAESYLKARMVEAANEIDRYYNGMRAWKSTAEQKDRQMAVIISDLKELAQCDGSPENVAGPGVLAARVRAKAQEMLSVLAASALSEMCALMPTAALDAVQALPAVPHWVPLSERRPDCGRYIITAATDEGPRIDSAFCCEDGQWRHEGEYTFQHPYYFEPVAWLEDLEPSNVKPEPKDA